ncbi:LGFP repeat-containing protein [Corynebacterium uterequi]|uniref:LGFP repeat protein n=1 Tax=Corynebacterium uterequi TaxID=1072256 RepID=A0A0G3HBL7_9CORY|nr:hypothetical protein [Corynebacterium uterequi]AKK10786.1 hypothetical protein CUTER_03900 [Corynebacterium uterequi]
MTSSLSRRLLAGAAALSLGFGLVACNDADTAASNAKGAASTAASEAKEAASEAKDAAKEAATEAKDAASKAKDAAKDAAGVDTPITLSDGTSIQVPADFATALGNEAEFKGAPASVEQSGDAWVATYPNTDHGILVYSASTGAVPVIGQILQTWTAEGGVDSALGLPTAPEEGDMESGWHQTFANGTIDWLPQGDGSYTADIALNQ